jgi:predicted aspartyl protease
VMAMLIRFGGALAASLLLGTLACADDLFDEHDVPRLQGQFTIGKHGRLILLPVTIAGKQHDFMLDTGACRTGIDVMLRDTVGRPRGRQVLQTPAGQTTVETYDWPSVTLNSQQIKTDRPIVMVDLTELRQASGAPVHGIIGMDVLRNSLVQIESDRGILRFLDALPDDRDELGSRIRLEYSIDGAPHLVARLADGPREKFLIDTGAHGNSLRTSVFDQQLGQKQIRLGSSFKSMTVGGEIEGNRGRIAKLAVGPFELEGLRVSRVNLSSLGLRYFSRFDVTFDFPGQAVYLRKGDNFAQAEPNATSGMALNWIDGKVVVKSVRDDGPAAKAGIKANDVLIAINGKLASDYDHFSWRQLLIYEPGRKVRLGIARDGRQFDVKLTLDED